MESKMTAAKRPRGKRVSAQRSDANGHAAPGAHLIRIPQREAMKRAIMVLGEVRIAYCGFTDSRLLVATEHIHAMQEQGIPFEQLS
jgi:hypothetical protein